MLLCDMIHNRKNIAGQHPEKDEQGFIAVSGYECDRCLLVTRPTTPTDGDTTGGNASIALLVSTRRATIT